MALRRLVEVLHLLNIVLVDLSAHDILAEASTRRRQRTFTRRINVALRASSVLGVSGGDVKHYLAPLGQVSGIAFVRVHRRTAVPV